MQRLTHIPRHLVAFILILCMAGGFRLIGINWDQGQHLHPDERFLTMVANDTTWPVSFQEYFDTTTSPLNPHNRGFDFYVYGTFPLFLTKVIAGLLHRSTFDQLVLVGRALAVLFEVGTVLFVFLLGLRTTGDYKKALIAMYIYALMILPIQSAHFFTVDSFLTFFLSATLFFLLFRRSILLFGGAGIMFGFAIASKISAVLFLPIVIIIFAKICLKEKHYKATILGAVLFIVLSFLTLRVIQPYLFAPTLLPQLNQKVLENWRTLREFDKPDTAFPPALQWIPTHIYSFPLSHMILWGVGPVIGLLMLIGIIGIIRRTILNRTLPLEQATLVLWMLLLFGYQGGQFAKPLRYLYPMYPAGAIVSSLGLAMLSNITARRFRHLLTLGLLFLCLWWTAGFIYIYTLPHTRLQASSWIYEHIPASAIILTETWDDALPLLLAQNTPAIYRQKQLSIYDQDTLQKWKNISPLLSEADYVMLTSNRLWRSLTAIPHKYPFASNYYKLLINKGLGYHLVASFTSYPCLVPGVHINAVAPLNLSPPIMNITQTTTCLVAVGDDGAEESFTVYDHPRVLIFINSHTYTENEIFTRITTTIP